MYLIQGCASPVTTVRWFECLLPLQRRSEPVTLFGITINICQGCEGLQTRGGGLEVTARRFRISDCGGGG
jgi:hypothetical protein